MIIILCTLNWTILDNFKIYGIVAEIDLFKKKTVEYVSVRPHRSRKPSMALVLATTEAERLTKKKEKKTSTASV